MLGAWLGALDPDEAITRREAASESASRAGATDAAELAYRRFLERYDQPAERHRPLVAEVRGRVDAR